MRDHRAVARSHPCRRRAGDPLKTWAARSLSKIAARSGTLPRARQGSQQRTAPLQKPSGRVERAARHWHHGRAVRRQRVERTRKTDTWQPRRAEAAQRHAGHRLQPVAGRRGAGTRLTTRARISLADDVMAEMDADIAEMTGSGKLPNERALERCP